MEKGKKSKRGEGKDPEHYFCARNITNSYFLKRKKKKHSGRFRVIQGRVETQCVFLFVRYANSYFVFSYVCCLTFFVQQCRGKEGRLGGATFCTDFNFFFSVPTCGVTVPVAGEHRLKLLLPVTAAPTSVNAMVKHKKNKHTHTHTCCL